MASGEMSQAEFAAFLSSTFSLIQSHCGPGALAYACMDWRHLCEMQAAGVAAGFSLINLCVWVKTNGGMGSLYRSRHELIFVFRNGSTPHVNNVQLGRYGRNRTNVWNYTGANCFQRGRERDLAFHPTVKPVRLVADAITDCTKQNDIILDPFLGSGTTILATQRTGRKGYGLELDPTYVDTAILRWERLTGDRAINASGEEFQQVMKKRSQPAPITNAGEMDQRGEV